jgi:cation transport ATPase
VVVLAAKMHEQPFSFTARRPGVPVSQIAVRVTGQRDVLGHRDTPKGYSDRMTEVDHSQHQGHVDQPEHGHEGHGGHHDHVAQFRRLFWIMVLLAIPTVALSGMFAMILGYTMPECPGAQWVSPVLGTVMYFWGGRPFLTGADQRDPPAHRE